MLEHNRYGGLTLVPLPEFQEMAEALQPIIEQKEGKKTPVDIVIPQFGLRASGEPFVRLGKDHIGDHDCFVIASGPGTYERLGKLYLMLSYLVGRRASRITLVLGYLPLGRSDKDEGSLELALSEHAVHMLESAAHGRLDRIIAADLHAPQVVMAASRPGLITEFSMARRLLVRAMEEATSHGDHVCLLFPDDGASKRFEGAVTKYCTDKKIDIPSVHGIKRRKDSKESRLLGLAGDVDQLPGATVLSLDDEIATGGSNIHTAEAAKQQYGVRRYIAAAIHGVLCGQAPILLAAEDCAIDKTYVTDSIPIVDRTDLRPLLDSDRLTVVPCTSDLANLIYFTHWGMNIREMR